MRRNNRINNYVLIITAFLSIGPQLLANGSPLGFPPLPFIRGGSATTATQTRTMKQQQRQRRQRKGGGPVPGPLKLVGNVMQGLDKIGGNIQKDLKHISKGMQGVQENIGREFGKVGKFVGNLPFLPPRKRQFKCSKLDDVCKSFSACLNGSEVDTAQLIKACRAHVIFMKSGGNSLRLVAKDLESNLQKAEKPFKKAPKQGKTLSSLLESERESGIHQGNILKEQSAAMGLLWIRRSLAFQLDLYASLISQDGPHPRDAANEAYVKHLSPYHGWALRKVFPASLSQMPDRQAFIAKFGEVSLDELNEEYDREIVKKLKALVAAWDPLINTWEKDFARLDLEDVRRV
jgi:hypothetical protein